MINHSKRETGKHFAFISRATLTLPGRISMPHLGSRSKTFSTHFGVPREGREKERDFEPRETEDWKSIVHAWFQTHLQPFPPLCFFQAFFEDFLLLTLRQSLHILGPSPKSASARNQIGLPRGAPAIFSLSKPFKLFNHAGIRNYAVFKEPKGRQNTPEGKEDTRVEASSSGER